ILETLADYGTVTKNAGILTEYCRQALGRSICRQYQNENSELTVFTVSPEIEKMIADAVVHTEHGSYLGLEPGVAKDIMLRIRRTLESAGIKSPVLLCSAHIRMYVRQLMERYLPPAAILSHGEVPPNLRVTSLGMVS
ncbi:MAG: EscV/YscV/HrcV family type III secretion system export apparatus protein, partial [Acidobacteria bacterium]|nr:EscV/YscV/HrcV family type III secretion system export apparatus protein [Acidobacteriota bacterium]